MKPIIIAVLALVSTSVLAQQSALELARQDLKTQKVAILTASIPMSEKQADAFWPIYREYDHELSKLGDRRMAVLKNYAANYDKLDEKLADQLVKESFSISNDRNSLLEKYYGRIAKALGAVPAARFVQVENQMLTLIDAQIMDQVPLVKVPKATQEKK